MKDKEMIEEMAKDFKCCYPCEMFNGYEANGELHNCNCEAYNKSQNCAIAQTVAKCLIGDGYRKLPKNSVALSNEEYSAYHKTVTELTIKACQSSKETAEKIFNKIKIKVLCEDMADDRPKTNYRFTSLDIMKMAREIVEDFGVIFENGHTTIKE